MTGPLPPLDPRVRAAMIADALDAVGVRDTAMSSAVQPLDPTMRLYGRAMTVTLVPADDHGETPYDDMIGYLDRLQDGSVAVVATGESTRCAFWGELFSTAASARGCRGVVSDGPVRDTEAIAAIGFPAFGAGRRPYDYVGRMRVAEENTDVVCGGLAVRPGDLVVGDRDGVVVVPRAVETEVLARATRRAGAESTALAELRDGATVASVWDRHRVL